MSKKATLLFSVAWAPLCWTVSADASEPKTAAEVVAKHIEAMGGHKKLEAVKTARMTGKSVVPSGMEVPMVIECKKPNKIRMENKEDRRH